MRYWQLCFLAVFVLAAAAHGQTDITLRFLDSESGKPLSGISVSVSAWDSNRGKQKVPPDGVLKIDKNTQEIPTDKNGRGMFHLDPQPSLTILHVTLLDDLHACSTNEFSIEQVLQTGVVAHYEPTPKSKWCPQLKAQASAKPGEIVIFDKRTTRWDRMRREIP